MTIERYFQWMRAWKHIGSMNGTAELERLHELLNVLRLEERDKTSPEKLQEFGASWAIEERI